ncbi:transcription initiation factor iia subunit 2 [Limosa lapponica baueri]|uniref:Transcription initiation factor iia subunit 2 n=1 Tax=Limosa lapponica baueri TaxID=1758121 RepID=A0A2I0TY95_LIMLA|nr:transcription initiation factor iia subunit 2 [Limosa lapponica baueri]
MFRRAWELHRYSSHNINCPQRCGEYYATCVILGSLNTYRFCDNVWTFVLNDVEFREVTELVKVDKVKIVACDGKNTGSNTAE